MLANGYKGLYGAKPEVTSNCGQTLYEKIHFDINHSAFNFLRQEKGL